MNDDHLAGKTGKNAASVVDAVDAVCDRCYPCVDIELAFVIGHIVMAGKFDVYIAERLIAFLSKGIAHELLHGESFRFALFTVEKKLSDFIEILVCIRIAVICWLSGPERIFIELQSFPSGTAVNHCPKPAVSNRQGFYPFFCGLVIPENHVIIGGYVLNLPGSFNAPTVTTPETNNDTC